MTLRAQVRNGRLELSEATDLPEGQIVELELSQPEDPALAASLDRGLAAIEAGHVVPAAAVVAKLRARS